MNLSAPFIRRPVATSLLTMGVILAGLTAYFQLPVSPLPKLDAPAIFVSVSLPGASPEVVSTSATTPLERHLGVIADVDQMTSVSTTSRGSIVLVFELSRDIDGAARDVQAAVVAARADLPTNLRSYPTYRKMNPNDAPILSLAMTSKTKTPAQIYDQADSILGQRLSQVPGVGQVTISGSSLPAVRVELNPDALYHYGIGLEDVRAAIGNANAHGPQGAIEAGNLHYQVRVNDQATLASQYVNLIIAYRNGRPVRLKDVSDIEDGVEDLRNAGYANGERAVSLQITRQPAANIIETVDRIVALLPELRASIPNDINLFVTWDRSASIRASLRDVQRTLLIAICLVTFVVFLFLRDFRSALIPTIAVPVSLIGTFSIMYLLDFSLNNLSLMALTVATGFVVDDAIVVLENVSRHLEAGLPRFKAAMLGAQEVGFTVVSMSLSLTAVFIPLLMMGGFLGRLFWEFSMTLTVSVLISMVISLTLTPVMCAYILRQRDDRQGRVMALLERAFERLKESYHGSLVFALDHRGLTMAALILTIVLNWFLFGKVPKGFFPQQDTGRLFASVVADQSTSFQSMQGKLEAYLKILSEDSAVSQVSGAVGAGGYGSTGSNSARFLIALKPPSERPDRATTEQVMSRLRPRLARVKGSQVFLQIAQEFGRGGRQSNALYQYTLQADNVQDLNSWVPRLVEELQKAPELTDVNSDQQNHGLESDVVIDRQSAGRLGIQTVQIDNTLYDAFGQRQVSTIFNPLNQYHVVMEVAPRYWQNPEMLKEVYVSTAGGAVNGSATTNVVVGPSAQSAATANAAAPSAASQIRNQQANSVGATGRASGSTASAVATSTENMIPLSAIASFQPSTTPVSINHQGLFVATTISFNLAKGKSLSDADRIIRDAMNQIGMPGSIHGSFQGAAQGFTQSMAQIPLLFLAAVAAIYIILGMLYESYVHPITILSTLPSAGVGAFVALILLNGELNLIADIGVVLLIGIVKKNAIMMIDFAIVAERQDGLNPRQAIEQACMLRFRPIMMTTMAALFGAVPLAIGFGQGSEMRQPLGISIVGGLILSQVLTLYTTPVVYLLLDRLRGRGERRDPRLLLNVANLQPGQ